MAYERREHADYVDAERTVAQRSRGWGLSRPRGEAVHRAIDRFFAPANSWLGSHACARTGQFAASVA